MFFLKRSFGSDGTVEGVWLDLQGWTLGCFFVRCFFFFFFFLPWDGLGFEEIL